MSIVKIFTILAIVLLFVGMSVTSMVGASKVLSAILQAYIFHVETCQFRPSRIPEKVSSEKIIEPDEKCFVDYNRAKQSIAEGLGLLLAALPVAFILSRKTFSILKEWHQA